MDNKMKMKTVFLVDDDIDLITQNKLVLEEKGFHVVTAYTGAEAKDNLLKMHEEKKAPDIMVVDVMMEHATAGLALARTVGELFRHIPVVILSGDPQKPNWMFQPNQTWDAVRYYLDKPVKTDKLVAVIEEVLSNGKRA